VFSTVMTWTIIVLSLLSALGTIAVVTETALSIYNSSELLEMGKVLTSTYPGLELLVASELPTVPYLQQVKCKAAIRLTQWLISRAVKRIQRQTL